jgi:hypothetical protein
MKVTREKEHGLQRQVKNNSALRALTGWTLNRPGMQQWHMGLRPKTEATKQQVDKGPMRQTASMSKKRGDIQLDLQEDHRQHEDRKARSQIICRVTGNQGLNLVEWSTPPPPPQKKRQNGSR